VEHIARVAPVIADFAALLYKTSASHRQQTRLNLCLDIPNFHYYQAIEEHLRNGSCTFNQALQWMDAVQVGFFICQVTQSSESYLMK